jgi:hypothetical protein
MDDNKDIEAGQTAQPAPETTDRNEEAPPTSGAAVPPMPAAPISSEREVGQTADPLDSETANRREQTPPEIAARVLPDQEEAVSLQSVFTRPTLNRRYLLAIPMAVAVLVIIIVSPGTLHMLQPLLKSLNEGVINGAEYFSVGSALVGGLIMLLLAFSFLPDYDRTRLAIMLEMSGACIGWILGMFLSPKSASEQQTFLSAKTALVGIISGYVLSKMQTALDKAVADGKILNLNSLSLALVFFVPLMLSTAAVYNVRAYQDLNVKITVGKGDIQTKTDGTITEYSIQLSKKSQFVAEARFPTNTAVAWSLDPPDGHGSINSNTGEYTAPSEMPGDARVDIVATSLGDKTKVSRLPLLLTKAEQLPGGPAPNATAPQTAPVPAKKP